MERFLKFLSGYVWLLIQGEQCERFLNLCRARGIAISKVCRQREDEITCVMSVRDFFRLRPIRSKTGVHIRVLEKHGMPFFFLHSKKRKAFFAGILLGFCLMALLSSKIWNIHIEGNLRNSTPEILEFLGGQGIVHGIAKGKINCSDLAAAVRRQYPEITWVSARIEGTRLILTIQEEEIEQEAITEEPSPCNLTADVEGTIVKIVTRSGIPLVKQGDICKKGDLLVLGRLDLLNDSQEVIRYEYVHADADIYVEHKLSYYKEFPLSYMKEIPDGSSRSDYSLRIGSWVFATGGKAKEGWRQIFSDNQLRITENFTLPVFWGKFTSEKIKKVNAVYSKEEAKTIAAEQLRQYEENLIQKGLQISANNVKIDIDYKSCTARGTLTVIERTGKETAPEVQEQPEERTSENG
ncbi:MAG: sporulation protein YqfD [Eubacteriales bacterium]|nr:sporulation protein YqfD [Eubacteriales bacterium]